MPRLYRSLRRRYRLFAPRLLRPGLLLLTLLLLGDGVAALSSAQIQAALALNTPMPHVNSLVAAPLGGSQVILARDTFQRADQAYWGTSSSGQNWLEDAQTDRNFTISHGAGLVRAAPSCIFCEAILGLVESDLEVTFTASLTRYGPSALCAILRWDEPDTFYKMVLDGQSLTLVRVMGGMIVPLQSIAFPARNDALYTFRFRADGTQLSAMVWPANQPPPADWQMSVQDSALTAGRAGIGLQLQNNTQAKIITFQVMAL